MLHFLNCFFFISSFHFWTPCMCHLFRSKQSVKFKSPCVSVDVETLHEILFSLVFDHCRLAASRLLWFTYHIRPQPLFMITSLAPTPFPLHIVHNPSLVPTHPSPQVTLYLRTPEWTVRSMPKPSASCEMQTKSTMLEGMKMQSISMSNRPSHPGLFHL